MMKNIKIQKSLVFGLKLLLFVLVLYAFYTQITKLKWEQFQNVSISNSFYLFLVLVLFVINWGLELVKWKKILEVNGISVTSYELFSSLFSGATTGIITPNRIGNFIGRIIYFKGKVRAKLTLGTLYSNYAQFLTTIVFGIIGILVLYDLTIEKIGHELFYLCLGLGVLFILFYLIIPYVNLERINLFKKKRNILNSFQAQSKELLIPIFIASSGRYLAFSVQYLFFLMAFGVTPSFLLLAGIFMFYLISTLIPSIFVGKIVIRETVGLLVLSLFVENGAIIVLSSILLWFVNLGLPSLIGLFFIYRKKHLAHA